MPTITCARCGKTAERMAEPPLKSKIGKEAQERVCAACWQGWKSQETMVINEWRLRLFDKGDRAKLDQACRQFLGMATGDAPAIDYTPPSA